MRKRSVFAFALTVLALDASMCLRAEFRLTNPPGWRVFRGWRD
jgi:hypothetical protein